MEKSKYVYKSNSEALEILKDCNAFQCYSGNVFINGEKMHLDNAPTIDGGEFWL